MGEDDDDDESLVIRARTLDTSSVLISYFDDDEEIDDDDDDDGTAVSATLSLFVGCDKKDKTTDVAGNTTAHLYGRRLLSTATIEGSSKLSSSNSKATTPTPVIQGMHLLGTSGNRKR